MAGTPPPDPTSRNEHRDPGPVPTGTLRGEPEPLRFPVDLYRVMIAHCRSEAPLEACGLLGGVPPRITAVFPTRNRDASRVRYTVDPKQLLEAHRILRQGQAQFVGFYHSHPNGPAWPSQTDIRENYYGDVPRFIVSLREAGPRGISQRFDEPVVRAWQIPGPDADGELVEVPWQLAPTTPGGPLTLHSEGPGYYTVRTFPPAFPMNASRDSTMTMECTLVIFKPDCVQRRLVGQILQRFEAKGIQIAGLKMMRVDRELAVKHYKEHEGKPFFEGLISFITSCPVVVALLEGENAIKVVRTMMGSTNGAEAAPGTIRGDFALSVQNNLIHGSDSPESAERERALWFSKDEEYCYEVAGTQWVTSGD